MGNIKNSIAIIDDCLYITDECIDCDVCIDECDVGAISEGSSDTDPYVIDQAICNKCEDYNDEPKCMASCPVDAIVFGKCVEDED